MLNESYKTYGILCIVGIVCFRGHYLNFADIHHFLTSVTVPSIHSVATSEFSMPLMVETKVLYYGSLIG
jgi:hypothetical protein